MSKIFALGELQRQDETYRTETMQTNLGIMTKYVELTRIPMGCMEIENRFGKKGWGEGNGRWIWAGSEKSLTFEWGINRFE